MARRPMAPPPAPAAPTPPPAPGTPAAPPPPDTAAAPEPDAPGDSTQPDHAEPDPSATQAVASDKAPDVPTDKDGFPLDRRQRSIFVADAGRAHGKNGNAPLGPNDKAWLRNEHTAYMQAFNQGVEQREVNSMSPMQRMRRVEKTLGLLSPDDEDDE